MPIISVPMYDDLENLVDEFSQNVMKSYPGDALKHFSDTASLTEKFFMAANKFLHSFVSPRQNMNPKAHRLMIYANSTVKPLKRAFGEEALLDALPERALNHETADLVEWLGGKKIAGLIRTALGDDGEEFAAPSRTSSLRRQP